MAMAALRGDGGKELRRHLREDARLQPVIKIDHPLGDPFQLQRHSQDRVQAQADDACPSRKPGIVLGIAGEQWHTTGSHALHNAPGDLKLGSLDRSWSNPTPHRRSRYPGSGPVAGSCSIRNPRSACTAAITSSSMRLSTSSRSRVELRDCEIR